MVNEAETETAEPEAPELPPEPIVVAEGETPPVDTPYFRAPVVRRRPVQTE